MLYPKEFLDEYKKLPTFNANITFYKKNKKDLTSKQISKNEKGYYFDGQYVGQTSDKLNAAIQKFCTDNQYTKIELKQTINLKTSSSSPSPTSAAGMAASRQRKADIPQWGNHVEDLRKTQAAKAAAAAAQDDENWIKLEKLVEAPETNTDSEAVAAEISSSLHPEVFNRAADDGYLLISPLKPSPPPIVQSFDDKTFDDDDADSAYAGSPPNSPDGIKEENSSRSTRLGRSSNV